MHLIESQTGMKWILEKSESDSTKYMIIYINWGIVFTGSCAACAITKAKKFEMSL